VLVPLEVSNPFEQLGLPLPQLPLLRCHPPLGTDKRLQVLGGFAQDHDFGRLGAAGEPRNLVPQGQEARAQVVASLALQVIVVFPLGHVLAVGAGAAAGFRQAGLRQRDGGGRLCGAQWLILIPLGWLRRGTGIRRRAGSVVVLLLVDGDVEAFHAGVQGVGTQRDGDRLPQAERLSLLHCHHVDLFTFCSKWTWQKK